MLHVLLVTEEVLMSHLLHVSAGVIANLVCSTDDVLLWNGDKGLVTSGADVQIRLAGELVEDLLNYLGVKELESTCSFPREMDNLR